MKRRSVSSVLAERIKQRRAVTQSKVNVRYVKFSPEEMAYDVPPDLSHLKWRRANPPTVSLDADVAEVFKTDAAVNNALRKLIEAVPTASLLKKRKTA